MMRYYLSRKSSKNIRPTANGMEGRKATHHKGAKLSGKKTKDSSTLGDGGYIWAG